MVASNNCTNKSQHILGRSHIKLSHFMARTLKTTKYLYTRRTHTTSTYAALYYFTLIIDSYNSQL